MTIISNDHKFIYTRPTKTGSSSTQTMIVNSGILGENDLFSKLGSLRFKNHDPNLYHHWTPEQLKKYNYIDQNMIENYKFLVTINNPIDRYISAYTFFHTVNNFEHDLNSFKRLLRSKNAYNFNIKLGKAQFEYFKIDNNWIPGLNVIPIDKINEYIQNFIKIYNGEYSEYNLKSKMKANWAKIHYSNWLNNSDITILKSVLEKELEEYYYVKNHFEYKVYK